MSKETVTLHIGMGKTATTSIQSGLKGFTDGVTRYARLGRSNHSIPLMTAFRKDPSRHLFYVKRGMQRAEVDEIASQTREKLRQELQCSERNLIFSGEDLCRLSKSEVERMKAFMEPFCDRFCVLAYIREPAGYSSSVFQQVARHGKITELSAPMPRYRRWFEKYIDLFGRDAVEFVLFEPAGFRDGCVITDFCDRVGIDSDRIAKTSKNESMSSAAVALLIAWNRHGIRKVGSQADVLARNRLIALLRKEFPGRFRIHRDLIGAKVDEEDCRWMEKQGEFRLTASRLDDGDAGLRSDAELTAKAEAAVPQLHKLLAARSLAVAEERPADMMDVLFQSLGEAG